MPGVGDQHQSGPHTANPFEETKPRMSKYTAQEIATLQSRLEKQLGPEFISSRPGAAGQKVHYVTAEKVINLANEVFGFNGWSSEIKNIQIDFVDENTNSGKISLGLSVIVRVTLKDGSFHEDIGYGHIENAKGKAMAFEKAKKEGTTDALKRALRNFGNILGNCVYDKEYIAKVTKVKIGPTKWDTENLHRTPQYASVKKEVVEAAPVESFKTIGGVSDGTSHTEDDEFGGESFDEADFGEGYQESIDGVFEDKDVSMGGMSNQANGRPHANSMAQNTPQTNQIPPRAPSVQQPRFAPSTTGQAPNRPGVPSPAPQTPNKPRIPPPQTMQQPHPQPQVAQPVATGLQSRPQLQGQTAQPATTGAQPRQPSIPQSALPGHRTNVPPRPLLPPQQQNEPQNHFNPNLTTNPKTAGNSSSPGIPSGHFNAPNPHHPPANAEDPPFDPNIPPATFFSARSAQVLTDPNPTAASLQKFNPHADSPSIRKTAGVNHGKSVPLTRTALGLPTPPVPAPDGVNTGNTGFVEPNRDTTRRVGAPPGFSMAGAGGGGGGGGGMSTSSFRSPMVKRNVDGNPVQGHSATNVSTSGPGNQPYQHSSLHQQQPQNQHQNFNQNSNMAARRPPLNDVTNTNTSNGASSPGQGNDAKRVKVEHGGNGSNRGTNGAFRPGGGAMGAPQQQPRAQ